VRIAIRGKPTPAHLGHLMRQIIDRLEATGVEVLHNINVYISPRIEGEELILVDSHGSEVEMMEIRGDPRDSELSPFITSAAMARITDLRRIQLLDRFAVITKMPASVRCRLLGVSEGRLNAILESWTSLELTPDERQNLTILGRLLEAALEILPDEQALLAWLGGPFPHSKLPGETPAEQIFQGDIGAVSLIVTELEKSAARKRRGLPQGAPPRHYDLA
jgi:hypothetical protein